VARALIARRVAGPWIMVDELIYSELAKSFAAHGTFLVRGAPGTGYGVVYPVLIAPAWRLFSAIPDAYALAKGINAVAMSLTVVPAYFLARRLVPPAAAVGAGVLAILVPSMLYTGALMTENAFYPLFVSFCLAFTCVLERPTLRRQVVVLAAFIATYATRAEAVALLPALAVGPLLLGWIDGSVRAAARAFAPLYACLVGGVLFVLAATVARGRSPLSVLGAYRAATSAAYSPWTAAKYLLWHVAELDLSLGVLPFAALLALWLAPRALPRAGRAFVAATLPVSVFLAIEVATFASEQSRAIEERNLFYLDAPALIALVAVAGRTLPRRPLLTAAAIAAALPVTIPFARFVGNGATTDTFGLLAWWRVEQIGVSAGNLRWVALAGAVVAGLVFIGRAWPVFVLPVLAGAYLVVTSVAADTGPHGIEATAAGSFAAGIAGVDRNWIDRAVGHRATVAVVWRGDGAPQQVWDNELFNRSVGPVYDLGAPLPGDLAETPVHEATGGTLVDATGRAVSAAYVLAAGGAAVEGTVVAADPAVGLSLLRVSGRLVIQTQVTGIYPDPGDTWSGPQVVYSRRDCAGGTLTVVLASDPALYMRAQVVTARVAGRVVGRASVPPAGTSRLVVALHPGPGSLCRVVFTTAQALVPARVIPGSTDRRPLGAHFLRFDFRP
jgi:hypothetical protein